MKFSEFIFHLNYFITITIIINCVYIYNRVHVCHSAFVEVRGQLPGLSPHFGSCKGLFSLLFLVFETCYTLAGLQASEQFICLCQPSHYKGSWTTDI